jgi:23S rRNA (cytidine1920-2'-O)/16S rRNA (cytidine1409-2'-O)-methyltransferase
VTPLERTNVRYLEHLPDGALADLAVIDASFISLRLVLPATLRLLKPDAHVVALIKPQFEAGRDLVGKGGVVRDAAIHRQVIEAVLALAQRLDLAAAGLTVSPAPGPAGNVEFLLWLRCGPPPGDLSEGAIRRALDQAALLDRGRGSEA